MRVMVLRLRVRSAVVWEVGDFIYGSTGSDSK